MLIPVDHQIVESGGDANGHPDPGETVDLIVAMKNFGSDATAVNIELVTDSHHISITEGSAVLGNVTEGETVDNIADPFTFEVTPNAPTGTIVMFSLNVTFVGGGSSSDVPICIGRFGYLVWDPTGDRSSGPSIEASLDRLGYSGTIRQSLPTESLNDYATLWVSFGIYSENYVLESSQSEGQAIVDFMAGGGNVYLEGGDVWAYDPGVGGFDFRPHFSVTATEDGSGDLGQVLGETGEFSEGMEFTYSGENSFIDHLVPTGDGFALLSNSTPFYQCGVAADRGTHRTVAASFELAGLEDGVSPSTRDDLVLAIMNFFGVYSANPMFADGFESGDTSGWSGTVP